MKQAANFRLDTQTLTTLTVLAQDLQTSKTDIIEKAVMQFAAARVERRNTLLQLAGTLDDAEANTILNAIQADKYAKDIDLPL